MIRKKLNANDKVVYQKCNRKKVIEKSYLK